MMVCHVFHVSFSMESKKAIFVQPVQLPKTRIPSSLQKMQTWRPLPWKTTPTDSPMAASKGEQSGPGA